MAIDDQLVAQCGHLADPIFIDGEQYVPLWCGYCLEEKARNIMPLDQALDEVSKRITPELMRKIAEDARMMRRRHQERQDPSEN